MTKLAKRPTTWVGITKLRTPFELAVNQAIGQMIQQGKKPTKDAICDAVGLDYYAAIDRNKVSSALYKHKTIFDYVWRAVYEPSPAYHKDFAKFSADTQGYSKWKSDDPELYQSLLDYGCSDQEIKGFWVMSKMWERFVQAANGWNLFLFVANGLTYIQPDFWEYTTKQIQSARRLGKGMLTILERHKDLGMMLTSGESINVALLTADDTLKMIADGRPFRHRCEQCQNQGAATEFETQGELFNHWQTAHNP